MSVFFTEAPFLFPVYRIVIMTENFNHTESAIRAALQQLLSVVARIDYLSAFFLGKPYIANPQGEGTGFDSAPLYRFDGFDCVTFVNNILALALSHDETSFVKKLLQLNYDDSIPHYENRFHFMSADWNPQNQKNNIVRDVTLDIKDEKNNVIAVWAEGEIDRPNWFIKKGLPDLAKKVKKEFVRLPYLPLQKLFDENKNPRMHFFNQFPEVSIVEIVRPNWDLKEKIGTNLHVSHLGFAIRQSNGVLCFRHASSEKKCVVEILLADYLKNCLNSPTIKGINVLAIIGKIL